MRWNYTTMPLKTWITEMLYGTSQYRDIPLYIAGIPHVKILHGNRTVVIFKFSPCAVIDNNAWTWKACIIFGMLQSSMILLIYPYFPVEHITDETSMTTLKSHSQPDVNLLSLETLKITIVTTSNSTNDERAGIITTHWHYYNTQLSMYNSDIIPSTHVFPCGISPSHLKLW